MLETTPNTHTHTQIYIYIYICVCVEMIENVLVFFHVCLVQRIKK